MRKQNKVNMLQQSLDDPLLEVKVKGYIPGAVLRNLRPDSPEDEHWSNEVSSGGEQGGEGGMGGGAGVLTSCIAVVL